MHQIFHLTGVRETASGITLYADHTFDFYLSFGAIDRHGYGTWTKENDTVILTSNYADKKGFAIVAQQKDALEGYQVSLQNPDPFFAGMMRGYAIVQATSEEQKADDQGVIQFDMEHPDKLMLMNALFPDQIVTFIPEPDTNHMIVQPNHDIFLLHFPEVRCTQEEQTLLVKLPLLSMYFGERTFVYEQQMQ